MFVRRQSGNPEFPQGSDGVDRQAEVGNRHLDALRDRVHYAGLGEDVNQQGSGLGGARKFCVARRADDWMLDNSIGEEFSGEAIDLFAIDSALEEIAGCGGDFQAGGNSEFGRVRLDLFCQPRGFAGPRIDVNFPKHRALVSLP